MPNWCSQYLTVEGDNAELSRLISETKTLDDEGTKFTSFNVLIPCPQELVEAMEGSYGDAEKQKELEKQQQINLNKYGHRTWYDWACDVYGTKWGACDVQQNAELMPDDSKIDYSFQSAWSPATGLLCGMSMLFPTLTFGVWFTEESNAFAGWVIYKNGETVAECDYEIQPPTEEQYPDENDLRDAWEVWQDEFTGVLSVGLSEAMQNA